MRVPGGADVLPIRFALILAASGAARPAGPLAESVHPPAPVSAPPPAAVSPPPDSPAPGLRLLLGFDEYEWVTDTALLARKLVFARARGYNGFICHFSAPAKAPGSREPAWVRGPETGYRWRFSSRTGPGNPGARQAWMARVAAVKRVAERTGMQFIPNIGAMGWGADYQAIDPATMAGEYLEIGVPYPSPNLFLGDQGAASPTRTDGWGDSSGSLRIGPDSADRSGVAVVLRRTGLYAAQWRIDAPWDAYLRFRLPVSSSPGTEDSAALKAYWVVPGAPLPYGARILAESGGRPGKPLVLELSLFVKRGETYYLDLEYHCRAPGGGTLNAGNGSLTRAAPPRERMVDAWGMRAFISSRSPALENVRWSDLSGPLADSAWASLSSVRATFKDCLAENGLRSPVDPLAPATRQITAGLFDALAEASGPGFRYVHLGGDEVFSLHRSKRQRRAPFVSMDPARLFAHLIRDRAALADSAFSRRHPGSRLPVYLVYGDMLTRLNGRISGTLAAADSLGASPGLRGRMIVMPWYYASMMEGLPGILPAGLDPAGKASAFLDLLRGDAARLSRSGLDFIGLYSSDDAGTGLQLQTAGADAWGRVCGEYAAAAPGRCLGLAYAGWDPGRRAPWRRNYNGMLLLARAWDGHPGFAADADGDGILDSLREAE